MLLISARDSLQMWTPRCAHWMGVWVFHLKHMHSVSNLLKFVATVHASRQPLITQPACKCSTGHLQRCLLAAMTLTGDEKALIIASAVIGVILLSLVIFAAL
jgi:hypothetical protein